MIDKNGFDELCKHIKDNYFEIVSDDKQIKSIWNEAGKLKIFSNHSRDESIFILDTLGKHGIYDFPFWLQRDVLIPLFEKNATPKQKNKYLKKMKDGELICALAITEETGGSSFDNIESRVQCTNNSCIITCKKNVVTNACFADVFFLVTKDTSDDLCLFLVERKKLSANIKKTNTVSFIGGLGIGAVSCNSLKMEYTDKLGDEGAIKLFLPYSLAIERFCCATLTIKICKEMYEEIVKWLKKRDIKNKYSSIWFELSDYYIKLLENESYFNEIKNDFLCNHNLFYSAAKLKYSAVNLALNLSSSIARICGCKSIDEDSSINAMRYLNLSHAYAAAGGTQEVMLQIISRYIQKLF